MENGDRPQPLEKTFEEPLQASREHGDLRNEEGAAGYIFLWLLGVPAGLLFVIFLLRGCN